jgi:hypothetical protein
MDFWELVEVERSGGKIKENKMSPILKQFLLKLVYALVGCGIATTIAFLSSNPLLFGGSTALIVALLTALEEYLFPAQPTA